MLAYGAFTVTCALGIFLAIKAVMGLRVDAEEEVDGLDYGEHGMHAYDLNLGGGSYTAVPTPAATAPVGELVTES